MIVVDIMLPPAGAPAGTSYFICACPSATLLTDTRAARVGLDQQHVDLPRLGDRAPARPAPPSGGLGYCARRLEFGGASVRVLTRATTPTCMMKIYPDYGLVFRLPPRSTRQKQAKTNMTNF